MAHYERNNERGCDGRGNNGQARGAHLRNLGKVETESKEDDRSLKDVFGREFNARLQRCGVATAQSNGYQHAKKNTEHGAANNLELLAEQPSNNADSKAQSHAAKFLCDSTQNKPSFLLFLFFAGRRARNAEYVFRASVRPREKFSRVYLMTFAGVIIAFSDLRLVVRCLEVTKLVVWYR